MIDRVKIKIFIFFLSTVLVGVCIFLFFLDRSLIWGEEKIFSCVFVNIWLFFMSPSIRYTYLKNRDKTLLEWLAMGMHVGARHSMYCVLAAPYFGLLYYFTCKSP